MDSTDAARREALHLLRLIAELHWDLRSAGELPHASETAILGVLAKAHAALAGDSRHTGLQATELFGSGFPLTVGSNNPDGGRICRAPFSAIWIDKLLSGDPFPPTLAQVPHPVDPRQP